MTTRCHAKINLFLSVGPPDPSGYHPVRTVMQTIGLSDDLSVEAAEEDSFSCDWPEMPVENTVTRALRLAREIADVPPLRIRLTKRIPAESGLGGGSSDAAGLLRILGRRYPHGLADYTLVDIAAAVGADVPFFLCGGAARAEGYGECVTQLPDIEPRPLLVVLPDVGVATGRAYAALDSTARPFREFPDDPWTLHNDFEQVAPSVCGVLVERLRAHGARAAQLTGSGSAVFGVFADEATAEAARRALAREGFPTAWVTRPIDREASLWTS